MQAIEFFLIESPLGKGYMAQTLINNMIKDEELIDEIIREHGHLGLDKSTFKLYIKAGLATVERLLAQGYSIVIPGFLRISPAVKGRFESASESYSRSRNYVTINCTVLKSFIDQFQEKLRVEKVERPSNSCEILVIEDNQTNANNLWLDEMNTILGINLQLKECEFTGIELSNISKLEESILVKKQELSIGTFSNKNFVFSFKRSFNPPAWLTNGLNLSVKLIYTENASKVRRESSPYETIWMI